MIYQARYRRAGTDNPYVPLSQTVHSDIAEATSEVMNWKLYQAKLFAVDVPDDLWIPVS